MKCKCEKTCIKNRQETLKNIETLYQACLDCHTKTLKKSIPLKRQIKLNELNEDYLKCPSCGKRHIDIVMAHILKILIDNNQMSSTSSIRKVGTPLITPAIAMDHLPYLTNKTLVIIISECDENTAKKIVKQVPEVKAVIKGDTDIVIGKITEEVESNAYELLAGCDIRCDIQNTDIGELLIYKKQSKLHIEYPKVESPKIRDLSQTLEKYESPLVLDAMCGPGTLGIYAIKKNAKKTVFNDIYTEAINSLKTNLEINSIDQNKYEIMQENVLELADKLDQHFDIGIIDAFPGIDTQKYVEAIEKICDEIIII